MKATLCTVRQLVALVVLFCAEVMREFCNAGPCATENDCPPGDACLDFSQCH